MNASKSLALAFCVGFLVAAPVTSCGPTSGGCDADSCAHGCCDSAGKCQTSTSVFQCGNNGQSCQICGASQQCIIGICTGNIPGGGGHGSTGGGSGTTGGGNGVTGGGNGVTGGGNGVTGGGNGVTGGGNGVTGGGFGTTGGGNGVTGGGNGVTGGGVGSTGGGTTGGGSPTCSTASALTISGGEFSVSGDTTGAQNTIHFGCSTTDSGEDLVYSFTLTGPVLFTAYGSFSTAGGLAIVSLGQCTSLSDSACVNPSSSQPYLQTQLSAGTWGLVVKTVTGQSGSFSISGYTETAATGGGSGTTGGGTGVTGGGVGTTGGGTGVTGGGVGTTGGGTGVTGGGTGTTGGGTGTGTALTNGSARSISGADSSQTIYYIDVPSGMTTLDITLTAGGSGDPDLYERFNVPPTISSGGYDFHSANGGSDSLSINASTPGRYYINVYGYATAGAYTATLTAEYY